MLWRPTLSTVFVVKNNIKHVKLDFIMATIASCYLHSSCFRGLQAFSGNAMSRNRCFVASVAHDKWFH